MTTVIVSFLICLGIFVPIEISSAKARRKLTDDCLLAGRDVPPWLSALSCHCDEQQWIHIHSPDRIHLSDIAVNCALIERYRLALTRAHGRLEKLIPKYFGMAMRLNALLAGAVSVQMILGGTLEFIAENST